MILSVVDCDMFLRAEKSIHMSIEYHILIHIVHEIDLLVMFVCY